MPDDTTNSPASSDDAAITSDDAAVASDDDEEEEKNDTPEKLSWSSSSESDSDYDSDDSDASAGGGFDGYSSEDEEDDNTPETNIRKFTEVLESRAMKKRQEEDERNYIYHEDNFDFPPDPDGWREEDIGELWADAPLEMTKPGWDPVWADKDDWDVVEAEVKAGRDPPIAPFYLPYRKPFPAIPDNHHDISTPKAVIEELDRVEEFLKWVSYVFQDGSSYEGTVWDDLAHGKGVYVAEQGLVRYEGEWLQNNMEGHGVVEVDIPDVEPVPGSKLEAKMRAEGRIIKRDFMSPDDKKWLEMDIEDSMLLAGDEKVIPFYENDEWINVFGEKPEKGRYRYAGQWKHSRMHGCGVYEVNERIIYGKFYFGELLEDSTGCDSDVSALHAGIAEVAAAKARMFINKPDGMVREERGPYGDPQHPYFYDEDDVWMAPGFVNQFYEVPDYWKTYVEEIDQEREMWLNSFYKSPLRIPMPAELEYWWANDEDPEFVLINKEPEPDPEDPTKLIYKEDPLIVHTPTGRLINYVDDEEHGIRLFWQPPLEEGEDVNPEKAQFLPLGFDEFYGRDTPGEKKESALMRLITKFENALKPLFDKLEKWTEEKKKASEMNLKLIKMELELVEAEICLDEAMEDMEIELKKKQKEEAATEGKGGDGLSTEGQDEADSDDGDDEGEDEGAPSSFGTVGRTETENTVKSEEGNFGKSSFSSLSLSLASCSPSVLVPSKLQEMFVTWKASRQLGSAARSPFSVRGRCVDNEGGVDIVNFPYSFNPPSKLRVARKQQHLCKRSTARSQLNSLSHILSSGGACKSSKMSQVKEGLGSGESRYLSILSLHVPITDVFTL